MRQACQHIAMVVAVAGMVMFTNLGGPRLWDRDEPRNAGCALEMLARGDWVTPVFNGELRTHKPVLLYWLMMSSYAVFGVHEFAARFWSAALAVGTAVCTYILGRRLFQPTVGVWAGVIVATTLMLGVAGRAATPDSALIFCSTLAITLFVCGAFPTDEPQHHGGDPARAYFPRWPYAAAMYGVMGVGMLAKGPVGLVLPTAVIGMFLLIMRLPVGGAADADRSWRTKLRSAASVFHPLHFVKTCWSMRPITAIAASSLIALPWYLWVGLRTDGEFPRGFFLEHNVSRAMGAMEGHDGGFLFYPVAILVGFFPWSVLVVPVILDALRQSRDDAKWRAGYLFAACWVGVYVVLFSLARTKLPSYVTPCYPALALATGCFASRWASPSAVVSRFWLRAALGIQGLIGLTLAIALPVAAHRYLPGEEWLGIIGLIPLLGAAVAMVLLERHQHRPAALTFAASCVLLMAGIHGGVADRISRHQENGALLKAIASRSSHPRVASFGILEPTWIFYGGQPVHQLSDAEAGSPAPAWIEVRGEWVPKPAIGIDDLLRGGGDVFIITTEDRAELLCERLPSHFHVLAEAPYFLKAGRLVVVGSSAPSTTARRGSPAGANRPR